MAELTTLARPYAKAAFEVAAYADSLQTWSSMLKQLTNVVSNERVSELLSSPSLTAEQQAKIVTDLCGDEINAQLQNFVTVLAENKRLALLPEIVGLFDILKAEQEQTVDVEISTAFVLTDETEEKLAQAIKVKLNRDVKIHSQIDKHLIGGMIIRAGDLVIDDSVRGKLHKLAEAMGS
ncbi:MAG: F0F1 ATP synthase subunit delta [SAR86 cluster bacterium]|uniref:ATP synthase subunit delta n=1 Tax=SAR86 cluster bacterium TaxID=2030880 RepID=A0A2A5CJ79_9GAMM|nr:MAG: F0F1 ATP synthase subunit delta [SAR86 cluster bacterium]